MDLAFLFIVVLVIWVGNYGKLIKNSLISRSTIVISRAGGFSLGQFYRVILSCFVFLQRNGLNFNGTVAGYWLLMYVGKR